MKVKIKTYDELVEEFSKEIDVFFLNQHVFRDYIIGNYHIHPDSELDVKYEQKKTYYVEYQISNDVFARGFVPKKYFKIVNEN